VHQEQQPDLARGESIQGLLLGETNPKEREGRADSDFKLSPSMPCSRGEKKKKKKKKSYPDGDKVLEGLAHLLSFNVEVSRVQEVVGPLLDVVEGLGLRNLIVVMREHEIHTSGVDVQLRTADVAVEILMPKGKKKIKKIRHNELGGEKNRKR
jgi:hypothetical protein